MIVLGLDPGTTKSALVAWNGQRVIWSIYEPNEVILDFCRRSDVNDFDALAVEKFESIGHAHIGIEVFETVDWSGRFREAYQHRTLRDIVRVTRREAKLHLCGTMKAKDSHVRGALMDRFGGSKAVGTKKNPGPLHGIAEHKWAALAVAVTYYDQAAGRE